MCHVCDDLRSSGLNPEKIQETFSVVAAKPLSNMYRQALELISVNQNNEAGLPSHEIAEAAIQAEVKYVENQTAPINRG